MRALSAMMLAMAASFAIVSLARADDTKKSEPEKKAFLGVGLSDEEGAIKIQVLPDSPADKAGLKDGDILLKIGDTEIKAPKDAIETVAKAKPGDKLKIQIRRDEKEQTITVTLAEKPKDMDD
jgi:S1-C subfamily serine protease